MAKLKTIFASVLGVTSPQNTPAWDSLNAIVLITEIEKGFDIRLTFDEAMSVMNFGDAVKLVDSKTHV
jgi:acyl carrier protein